MLMSTSNGLALAVRSYAFELEFQVNVKKSLQAPELDAIHNIIEGFSRFDHELWWAFFIAHTPCGCGLCHAIDVYKKHRGIA